MTRSNLAHFVSAFCSLGFALSAAAATWYSSLLPTKPQYPLGYWICLFTPLIYAPMFLLVRGPQRWGIGNWIASGIPLLAALVSMLNFHTSFPEMTVLGWLFYYSLLTFLTLWVESIEIKEPENARNMQLVARIEWIKEKATFWRSATTSITLGYLAVAVAWSVNNWTVARITTGNDTHTLTMGSVNGCMLLFLSIYVMFGLLRTAFHKAEQANALFTQLTAG